MCSSDLCPISTLHSSITLLVHYRSHVTVQAYKGFTLQLQVAVRSNSTLGRVQHWGCHISGQVKGTVTPVVCNSRHLCPIQSCTTNCHQTLHTLQGRSLDKLCPALSSGLACFWDSPYVGPLHSPLLGPSLLFSLPPASDMLKFTG